MQVDVLGLLVEEAAARVVTTVKNVVAHNIVISSKVLNATTVNTTVTVILQ